MMPSSINAFLSINNSNYVSLAFLLVILAIVHAVSTYRVRLKMPPGPLGIPILGNIFQVPNSMPWFKFTEWKRKYGMFQHLPAFPIAPN